MKKSVTFKINGRLRTLTTDSRRSLLEILREDLRLTGAKYGCGEGQCGACTVLVNGKETHACLTSVADVDQSSITTIEGLGSDKELHPVQKAFLEEDAFQCGFCTPGMILAVVGLLKEKPRPTESEIRARLEPHLCRCCGYPKILKAAKRAAA